MEKIIPNRQVMRQTFGFGHTIDRQSLAGPIAKRPEKQKKSRMTSLKPVRGFAHVKRPGI